MMANYVVSLTIKMKRLQSISFKGVISVAIDWHNLTIMLMNGWVYWHLCAIIHFHFKSKILICVIHTWISLLKLRVMELIVPRTSPVSGQMFQCFCLTFMELWGNTWKLLKMQMFGENTFENMFVQLKCHLHILQWTNESMLALATHLPDLATWVRYTMKPPV